MAPNMTFKSFPLLSLPDELLDLILSYIIIIPWHPKNGAHIRGAILNLFGPTLRVNRKLRSQTVDIIVRDTLWVRLSCQSPGMYETFHWFDTMPKVPPVYRRMLPNPIPGIIISIGKPAPSRSTRALNDLVGTFVFPFNIHSFTRMYSNILSLVEDLQEITITYTTIPAQHRKVVNDRIRPILDHLRLYLPTLIIDYDGSKTEPMAHITILRDMSSLQRMDELVPHIRALDRLGRSLEASFLALSLGTWFVEGIGDYADSMDRWLQELTTDDYLTQRGNLQRMQTIRTLHYINYRSCMAHLCSSRDEYGDRSTIGTASDTMIYRDDGSWTIPDCRVQWYGLPDHEHARLYYLRARLFVNREPSTEDDSFNPRPDYDFLAIKYAYVAWRLDKSNVMYATLLKWMVERRPDTADMVLEEVEDQTNVVESFATFGNKNVATVRYVDEQGHQRIYGGTLDVYCQWQTPNQVEKVLKHMWRAKEVAKRADVAYDDRREEELSKLEYQDVDEVKVLGYLLRDLETGMKFDRFGITEEDLRAFEEKERRERGMLEAWGTLN